MSSPKSIVLLGATGSIGESTLRVIQAHPDRLNLLAIAGNQNIEKLAKIAADFKVPHVAIFSEAAYQQAVAENRFPESKLYQGAEGLVEIATLPDADMVTSAIVGTHSLHPTLAAIEQGKDIALASKEILVLAGKFIMAAARRHNARVLPMDSEHNAIFQCLQGERAADVSKLILTASGGPFRDFTAKQMAAVTTKDALQHPNWDMGPKITIDSSTMANKGLEVIEAKWLFGKSADEIDVVIHPQSIIHSMVQFVDGSLIAQLSPPSMTFAIQHTLLYPERAKGVDTSLNFGEIMSLDFSPPDLGRFPCLRLAFEALRSDGIAPAAFNAANEIAVEAFLNNRISYLAIPDVIHNTLENIDNFDPSSLEAVIASDAEARRIASTKIS